MEDYDLKEVAVAGGEGLRHGFAGNGKQHLGDFWDPCGDANLVEECESISCLAGQIMKMSKEEEEKNERTASALNVDVCDLVVRSDELIHKIRDIAAVEVEGCMGLAAKGRVLEVCIEWMDWRGDDIRALLRSLCKDIERFHYFGRGVGWARGVSIAPCILGDGSAE